MTTKICANPNCNNTVKRERNMTCSHQCRQAYNLILQSQGDRRQKTTTAPTKHRAHWGIMSEREHVKWLGLGKHALGSDLRHNRAWWLKQYIVSNDHRQDVDYIAAGLRYAKQLLAAETNRKSREQNNPTPGLQNNLVK